MLFILSIYGALIRFQNEGKHGEFMGECMGERSRNGPKVKREGHTGNAGIGHEGNALSIRMDDRIHEKKYEEQTLQSNNQSVNRSIYLSINPFLFVYQL